MSEIIVDYSRYTGDGICDCAWGKYDCPNAAEFILKNKNNCGFSVMCLPHKESYLRIHGLAGVEVHPYSKELVETFNDALTFLGGARAYEQR